jgi:cytochrome c556
MTRAKWLFATLIGLGMAAGLAAQGGNVPDVATIMEKAHAARKGLRAQIKDAVDKGSPDWADLQKKSKQFYELANALEKNAAPKGDKAEWVKLSKAYAGQVKDLDAAVAKKNGEAVKGAIKKLDANCMDCHDKFRD